MKNQKLKIFVVTTYHMTEVNVFKKNDSRETENVGFPL
jgi:hypothetical protein